MDARITRLMTELDMQDMSMDLPRRAAYVERRSLWELQYITVHYNGPPTSLPANERAERNHIKFIAQYHVDKIWGWDSYNQQPIYGHGIMYDAVAGPSGQLYLTRDLQTVLWHCGNGYGNRRSLALHLPLGGNQAPTKQQWASAIRFFDVARDVFGIRLDRVLGHREWEYQGTGNQSICPGPVIQPMVESYRNRKRIQNWKVVIKDSVIREGPGTNFPVACKGEAVEQPGFTFLSDDIVLGQLIGNSQEWIHLADGRGFMHRSLVEAIV